VKLVVKILHLQKSLIFFETSLRANNLMLVKMKRTNFLNTRQNEDNDDFFEEIIVENHYDDFTKAVMMGYTLLLTDRYKDSTIEIKTLVDTTKNRLYNVVYVDDTWVLNYSDTEVVTADNVPSLYNLENLVNLERPR
jgi:hypothetical protein